MARNQDSRRGRPHNNFAAVAAVAHDDVWAVGSRGGAGKVQPLIEHWNGRRWNVVGNPRITGSEAQLLSASAASPVDVWAVGFSWGSYGDQALIEHWDGQAWSVVPPADVGDDGARLFAVAALAPDRAWAVGRRDDTALIEEWNGTSWRALDLGDQGADTAFFDVAATSPSDVWAVGYAAAVPLVEHWDGEVIERRDVPAEHYRPWTRRRLPTGFSDVLALSPRNVWMTGFRIEHWTGNFHAGTAAVGGSSLAAVSSRDIWEAGSADRRHGGWGTRTLHYACK